MAGVSKLTKSIRAINRVNILVYHKNDQAYRCTNTRNTSVQYTIGKQPEREVASFFKMKHILTKQMRTRLTTASDLRLLLSHVI